ncbi:ATP-binding protein [Streptomyces mirabilis]|jgi:anti-sigma regulatory factor (Ser/Thr protein kinase)|uniref:ATP-binding protein n=1 Tax=Streptomyces TaxID=1883 RepID=UPI000BB0EB8F|nr:MULTISPECIES: ATP-binding protein [unclassified Streptomyces]PBC92873.1 anti-sigma regulatory factor (Ser/Thr protein kinase) [Streptomyces sp. Ag82_O1-15]SOF02777.1 Anti-sigma regulatory factor (Ser/Thr protein kinase) [Streptomyces sp. OV198]
MEGSSLRAVGWARTLPLNSEVKTARDWAREHLEALGWSTAAPQTVDAVLLTVSELVTNAHRHAHSSAQLVMTCDDQCLHVSVHDKSGDLPVPREAGTESLGGRGMFLVDAMADTWEAHPCPHGKSVSACFRAPGAKAHEVDAPAPSRNQ